MTEATALAPDLRASDATIAWCLRRGASLERQGDAESAARWAYVAAGTAAQFGHSYLTSVPLETMLLRLGQREPRPAPRVVEPHEPRRWLHVLSMSFAVGGHTAIAQRWIARNPFGARHDVVLTAQAEANCDPDLAAAVRGSGGDVRSLAEAPSLLERAAALRAFARERADVVVLHVHPWDVVPPLAFATTGGPPVLLVNHADHAFWLGAAIADIVVDIRDIGVALSRNLRATRGSALLPVPIVDRGAAPHDRSRAATRVRTLGDRRFVLLTVASAHKYRPQTRLDFAATALRIIEALDDCILVAVGPSPEDPLWTELAERSADRIVAVGYDRDLAPWHAATDLYLESFPIGSYTALLEAGLAARAFVRKPHLAPPSVLPIDRGALAAVEPPADMDAYVGATLALAHDPARRAAEAEAARRAVLSSHCGAAWDAQLAALERALPDTHAAGLACEPPPMPPELVGYWAEAKRDARGPFAFARERALENRLTPRTDVALLDALRAAGA